MESNTLPGHPQLPWTQPGWQETVLPWIDQELTSQGIRIEGPLEILHMRTWSAFASIPTSDGIVYFKAPSSENAFEAALTQKLVQLRPDCMVRLLAVDLERGWTLSADSGDTLRSFIRSVDDLPQWDNVLPFYADFQIDLAQHLPDLLLTGAPDRRLELFPNLYRKLLEDTENLRVENPPGLSSEEHRHLLKLQSEVEDMCLQLDSYGLPETICHEEVHDANVILDGERVIFTDWADSSVAHPFFTMLVTIRSAAYRAGLDQDAPEMAHLRDIYLEPWSSFGSPTELREALDIAYRLAMINRSLSYHLSMAKLPEEYKIENDAIPGWLQDFLETVD
jgi:hypothetical protein